jgi:hypothetical protein
VEIDNTTHKINRGNYNQKKHKKRQIILAGSLRKDSNHIKHLKIKDYGKTKKWPTFSITRDGQIYQHFDPKYHSEFMGVNTIDRHSISVVLENMGSVFYDNTSDRFVNWIEEECPEELLYEKEWKGCRYWESYTEDQFNATLKLSEHLIDLFEIKKDCLGFNVFHDHTKGFEGIVTRSNYDTDYEDLNPSFDFGRFLDELGVEYN